MKRVLGRDCRERLFHGSEQFTPVRVLAFEEMPAVLRVALARGA